MLFALLVTSPPLSAHYEAAYAELLRIARTHFSRATPTLDTVALVSEAYLRLQRNDLFDWSDTAHVRATACRAMRQIVCNHLRDRRALKRDGGPIVDLTLDRVSDPHAMQADDLLALDDALVHLATASPRQRTVVEMRLFGGYGMAEISDELGVSDATVQRDWRMAALFLRRSLDEDRHARAA